jgi:hypothetical protein
MIASRDKREKSSIMMCKKQDLYFPTNKQRKTTKNKIKISVLVIEKNK